MPKALWKKEYDSELSKAIEFFWKTRESQSEEQKQRGATDAGRRGTVTGGQHMNSLAQLMRHMATDVGVPPAWIYSKANELPGYFRPTKKWDLLIISDDKRLLACIEFKSHVGPSFGNNYNNRVEEALGDAVDIHSAYQYGAFGTQDPFWAGYLMVLEKSPKSTSPVEVKEPYFSVLEEFAKASYMDRYRILCHKLMMERHYDSTCLIWTDNIGGHISYGMPDKRLSFRNFASSYMHFLAGKLEAKS